MAEPTAVTLKFTIQSLLDLLDDELHGYKAAFSEAQKIRTLNKAKDEVWKILKSLRENYFTVFSQSTTSANDDFFDKLSVAVREYLLPKNYGEMVFSEVLGPVGYESLKFARLKLTSPKFFEERASASQAGSSQRLEAGVMHYDITGPDSAGRQTMVLATFPPVDALDVRLWYMRSIPQFTVPKVSAEELASVLSPYVPAVVSYATKSLLQRENVPLAERWEKEWRMDLERTVSAADERDASTPEYVEEFSDTSIEDTA